MSDGAGKYRRLLDEAIENLSQYFFDSYGHDNAEFRTRSGLPMIVIREELGDCCSWCADLAGTYDYADAPPEVWQRHAHCRCMVITRTEKGAWQDAWSRKEYQSEREARIAREKEIKRGMLTSDNTINPYERIAAIAEQEGKVVSIPPFMEGNFDDCHPLSISDEERATFQKIHEEVAQSGCEYGEIITSKEAIPCYSDYDSHVKMDTSSVDEKGIKLYHGHTNDTPPSEKDLSRFVYDEKVDIVGVVTRNRDVFIVDIGDGYIPNETEYWDTVKKARIIAETNVLEKYNLENLSEEQIEYLVIREKNIEIIRQFGWRIEGGKL